MATMAAAGAFGPDAHHNAPQPHGKKRRAENNLETEQRLSKRLDLLNLDNNGTRLYVPVPGSMDIVPAHPSQLPEPKPLSSPVTKINYTNSAKSKRHHHHDSEDDTMQVEDTPHRIFIRSLSDELSDTSSDEETPIFLPDIEKHIAKIPDHILRGPELKATKDNQLVLYSIPTSLTVPEEQDRVRKAIVEARARLREKQASPVTEPEGVTRGVDAGIPEVDMTSVNEDEDPDAMDLD